MENPILGGGYTCSECGQYQRTSAVCDHFNLIDISVKHNLNMKTKEEIEQLAFLKYPRLINDPYNPMEDDNTYERQIWIDGYTQCQEDMADKKYTEEQILFAFVHGGTKAEENKDAKKLAENFKDVMKILNKQD
jgi:hypothetical protein